MNDHLYIINMTQKYKIDSPKSGDLTPSSKPAAQASKADQILAAGRACFERRGMAATTVEDVLAEAGVSRSTFYRLYSGLDAVIAKIAIIEGRGLLSRSLEATTIHEAFAERLTAVLVHAALHSSESPWISRLNAPTSAMRTAHAVFDLPPQAIDDVGQVLHPLLELGRQRGELRTDLAFGQITEWLLRNLWSLLTTPGHMRPDEKEMGRYVREFVLAGILVTPAKAGLGAIMLSLQRIEKALDSATTSGHGTGNP